MDDMDTITKLVYELMEIVCDNCDKWGGECISCNVASKIFKVLDNYEIDEKDERYKMIEESVGETIYKIIDECVEETKEKVLGKDIPYLTDDKKIKFKELKGSATIPIDLNKVMECHKYGVELDYMWNKDEDE